MPDISMCAHPTCPSRSRCYRHAASGTVPSEMRQSYMGFEPGADGRCSSFLDVGGRPVTSKEDRA